MRLIAALVPLTVLAALLAGDHVPVLAGGLIGVLGLEAAFYLVRIVYRGGPVRPGILLSPVGVQVTRTDSSGDFLPAGEQCPTGPASIYVPRVKTLDLGG